MQVTLELEAIAQECMYHSVLQLVPAQSEQEQAQLMWLAQLSPVPLQVLHPRSSSTQVMAPT